MNRIILKVKLLSEKSALLTLVYVDKRFLSKDENDFRYFYEDSQDFMIYSFDKFTYTMNTLKLPSVKNYEPCQTLEISFLTEDKLKSWLRGLYKTLQIWNNEYPEFKKQEDYEFRPKKMVLGKETWIL